MIPKSGGRFSDKIMVNKSLLRQRLQERHQRSAFTV